MSTNQSSTGVRLGELDGPEPVQDPPIARVDGSQARSAAGEGVRGLQRQAARQTTNATLVVASPLAEDRQRWIHRLQRALAVCEVTGWPALERVMVDLKPDLLIVDLTLPGLRRVRGLPHIRRLSPSTKIIALTDAPDDAEGLSALKAGVKGYCARTIEPAYLRKAVAAVQRGEIWAPRRLVSGLIAELVALVERRKIEGLRPKLAPGVASLTDRQRTVADLISSGASNKQVADLLKISERTVKAHLTEAFRNVGVSDRLQLALLLKGHRRTSA